MQSRASAWSSTRAKLLRISTLVTAAAIAGAASPTTAGQATFRTGVVLLTIDVQVMAAEDAALREFGPEDFDVSVSGHKRPVISAALLHRDEGSVIANPPRLGPGTDSGCIFGFHRKTDRPTAHYLLGIQPVDSDRGARRVQVKTVDAAYATQWLVWRLPVRQGEPRTTAGAVSQRPHPTRTSGSARKPLRVARP